MDRDLDHHTGRVSAKQALLGCAALLLMGLNFVVTVSVGAGIVYIVMYLTNCGN